MDNSKAKITMAIPQAILDLAAAVAENSGSHCTAHPQFVVQRERIIAGVDMDYADSVGYFQEGVLVDEATASKLESQYIQKGAVPAGYIREGYHRIWENEQYFFSEKAAQDFVRSSGPQYRVFVESAHRNHEWKAIREFLAQVHIQANNTESVTQ